VRFVEGFQRWKDTEHGRNAASERVAEPAAQLLAETSVEEFDGVGG
jgi:hypothetical protein